MLLFILYRVTAIIVSAVYYHCTIRKIQFYTICFYTHVYVFFPRIIRIYPKTFLDRRRVKNKEEDKGGTNEETKGLANMLERIISINANIFIGLFISVFFFFCIFSFIFFYSIRFGHTIIACMYVCMNYENTGLCFTAFSGTRM